MPSETRRAIDTACVAVQRAFKPLYRAAEKDMRAMLERHLARHSDALGALYESLESGDIAKAEYVRRVHALLMTGPEWKAIRRALALRMYDANDAATRIINGALPAAYADSASRAAFRMEKQAKRQVGLVPCTAADVEAMAKSGDIDLHPKRIKKGKDTRWNEKRVTSSVIGAAALGYGAAKLCSFVSRSVTRGGYSAMCTASDTVVGGVYTSAQADAMDDAEACGLVMEKTWIATLDHKTRDTHQELDGQTIPIGEKFVTINGEIDYPLDPAAPLEETCNCRCAMTEHVAGFKLPSIRRENIRNEDGVKPIVNATTYREWKSMKEQQAGGAQALADQWKAMRREEARRKRG